MTTTTTDVDHGITITEVHLPAGTPLRAECLCGWQSKTVPSRPQAAAVGAQHTAEATYPECGRTRYIDAVATAVAERIRERGTVLTVDELATVAMALDCSASELLPLHLAGSGASVSADLDRESAANGLHWDDEAGTVEVRRLPWMSDAQWKVMREGMMAHFDAAGLIRDEATR